MFLWIHMCGKNSLDACGKLHVSYFIRRRAQCVRSRCGISCVGNRKHSSKPRSNNKTFILKTSMVEKQPAIRLRTGSTSTAPQRYKVSVCVQCLRTQMRFTTYRLYDGMQTDRKLYTRYCAWCSSLSAYLRRATISHIGPSCIRHYTD